VAENGSHLTASPLFSKRSAGVLLHPTSLPSNSEYPSGDLGKEAYNFVNFLAEAGFSIWQMLPTGPTHGDLSPYQSISAHAGNPELISLEDLVERGWIAADDKGLHSADRQIRQQARQRAAVAFFKALENNSELNNRYREFYESSDDWLADFALFQALRVHYQHRPWNEWPLELIQRDPEALKKARTSFSDEIKFYCFEQFIFFEQWQHLRNYARKKGVYLFGDMPIFVAHDSADVWAGQHNFRLDEKGNPLTVAGVPPDYFSEFGQHWGNPHYDWERMESDGFAWWLARLRSQLKLFDLIRIDHFRGFEAFWEIPGHMKDAREGRWVKAPGKAFLTACFKAYHNLPLVAENLGVITDEVEQLRNEFQLPGMLVLQFGFDDNPDNPHLPHKHGLLDVIYTGTHDNDTTVGWYQSLSAASRQQIDEYFYHGQDAMPWLLIKAAFASVSRMAIVPMQDLLELDGDHRMNMPGTTDNNWTWRFNWEQVPHNLAVKVHKLLKLYGRLAS
jgi:4-alpha-glucanotransferase